MDDDVLYGDIAIALGYVRREQLVAHSHRAWMARQRGQILSLRSILLEANALTAAQDARIMRMVDQRAGGSVPPPKPKSEKKQTAVVDAVMVDAGDGVAPNVTLLQVQLDSGIAEAFSSTNNDQFDEGAGATIHGATATRTDRYEVTLTVARDEAGQIAWAHDRALLREVSIATLHRTDEVRRARFAAEAQLVCELDHPNVPLIHEVGVDPSGQPFVVTARARGCPLTALLAATRDDDLDPLPMTVRRATTELENQLRALAAAEDGSEMAMNTAPPPDEPDTMTPRRRRQRIQARLDVLLDIFCKVCEVVEHAHANGVIHRDLKPDNILVGERGDITVIEWSLARRISQLHTEGPASLTKTEAGRLDTLGAVTTIDSLESPTAGPFEPTTGDPATTRYVDGPVAGTPAYMSPEAANGQLDRLTQQSDVYSLGATLLHVLGCIAPVEGDSLASVLRQVLMGEIPRVRSRSKAPWRVPRELEAIALKAMSRTPNARYASAAALEADVVAWRRARRARAAGFPSLRLLRGWAVRRPKLAIGSLVACLLGVVGCAIAVMLAMDARVSAAAAEANADVDAEIEAARNARIEARADPNSPRSQTTRLRERASSALSGQPDAAALAAGWTAHVNHRTGASLAIQRDPAALAGCKAAYLAACAHLDLALALAETPALRDEVRAERASCGRGLGYVALFAGDAVLAARAFDDLRELDVDSAEVESLVAYISTLRGAQVERDVARLRAMLQTLEAPAPTDPLSAAAMKAAQGARVDSMVREASAFRHAEAASVLRDALEPLRELAAARGAPWHPTQPQRDVASFCLRVLPQLGLEQAMRPLNDFAEAVWDHALAIEAGHALCATGRAAARRALMVMWARFGAESDVWRAIAPRRANLPLRVEPFDANLLRTIAIYERACSDGDAMAARNALDALINAAPDDVTLRLERAASMIDAGDHIAAEPDLAHVRKLEVNNNGLAAYLSARLYLIRGEHTAADMWATTALRLVSHVPSVWRVRAQARRPGSADKALSDLDEALAITPYQADTWLLRVLPLRDKGDPQAVVDDLTRALTYLPSDARLWLTRGSQHADLDDWTAAIADTSKAIALDGSLVRAYEVRGTAYLGLGRYDEGIADLDRVARIDPDGPSPIVLYNRGLAHLRNRNANAAVADLRTVAQSSDGDWITNAHLGVALSRLGDIAGANLAFERANQLVPADSRVALDTLIAEATATYEEWKAMPVLNVSVGPGRFAGALTGADQVSEGRSYDSLGFEGRAGQRLRVYCHSLAFDPHLVLGMPSKDQTEWNGDITVENRDAFLEVTLTETGRHVVYVITEGDNQLGLYWIEFELLD